MDALIKLMGEAFPSIYVYQVITYFTYLEIFFVSYTSVKAEMKM